jgi:hypothetical protein
MKTPNARRELIQPPKSAPFAPLGRIRTTPAPGPPAPHPRSQIRRVLPVEQYKTTRETAGFRGGDRQIGREGGSYLAAFAHDHRRGTSEAALEGWIRRGGARQGGAGGARGADLAEAGTVTALCPSRSTLSPCLVRDGRCAAGGGPMAIVRLRSCSSRKFAASVSTKAKQKLFQNDKHWIL